MSPSPASPARGTTVSLCSKDGFIGRTASSRPVPLTGLESNLSRTRFAMARERIISASPSTSALASIETGMVLDEAGAPLPTGSNLS